MPSQIHEALALLFRECPTLGPILTRESLDLDLSLGSVDSVAAEFAELDPAEYRADAVLRIGDAARRASDILIVEVQLQQDQEKLYTWPRYSAGARLRFRCPATVVAICPDRRVARWAGQTVTTDRMGSQFRALAIGPEQVPAITAAQATSALPELAVLSAIMHGHDDDAADIGAAAFQACERLDDTRARIYTDIIFNNLGDVARAALEKVMELRGYQYPQSDFAKKHYGRGRAEGRTEGQRELLRRLLVRKFGELSSDVTRQLNEASDDDLLRWSDRIVEVESLAAVFAK